MVSINVELDFCSLRRNLSLSKWKRPWKIDKSVSLNSDKEANILKQTSNL